MQVNTNKTKVMKLSLRKKQQEVDFQFKGNTLEIVEEYKYLGIDFNNKLNWETCRYKHIQGSWRASFLLQNMCR